MYLITNTTEFVFEPQDNTSISPNTPDVFRFEVINDGGTQA
jgi:hypothetical protein